MGTCHRAGLWHLPGQEEKVMPHVHVWVQGVLAVELDEKGPFVHPARVTTLRVEHVVREVLRGKGDVLWVHAERAEDSKDSLRHILDCCPACRSEENDRMRHEDPVF